MNLPDLVNTKLPIRALPNGPGGHVVATVVVSGPECQQADGGLRANPEQACGGGPFALAQKDARVHRVGSLPEQTMGTACAAPTDAAPLSEHPVRHVPDPLSPESLAGLRTGTVRRVDIVLR